MLDTANHTLMRRPLWQAIAIAILLFAATLILVILASSLQPGRAAAMPPYLRGNVIASGVINPPTQLASRPNVDISDSIPMTLPEAYLGVGSPLAVSRSNDPNMRLQGYWLSLHSPGVPK